MCGICGLIHLDSKPLLEQRGLYQMMDAVRHRGPDDEGIYLGHGIGLAMRRLSIIDIAGGQQPIQNEAGGVHVVLNGEIYNFRELRKDLETRAHTFQTNSDAEVIVHLYEEHGKYCVQSLRGMFAFALWDEKERKLLIARDRMGVKPLYYWQGDSQLVFASEVRALLASGLLPRKLSIGGLRSYLAYGALQEPLTMIENVFSLLPGHLLTVRDGQVRIERYWDLPEGTRSYDGLHESEVQERIREALVEAVRLRLVSDVPLGAFLSGGIDSGAVVGMMSEITQEPVRTFTIGFEEQNFDESCLADITAQRWGTEHTRIVLSQDQILCDLQYALAAMDQPTIDGINTWFVARATKQAGVTVALSGLGGDELFAGYKSFKDLPLMIQADKVLNRISPMIRQMGGRSIVRFLPEHDRRRKMQTFLDGEGYFNHPYFFYRMIFTPRQVRELFRIGSIVETDATWLEKIIEDVVHAETYDVIGSVSYLELRHYLLSTLLRDADCMSMAHSLEVRVPLIDHHLVELVIKLPARMKIGNNKKPKPLLVNALQDILPSEIISMPKRTFTFPWSIWLKGSLRSEIEEVLLDNSGVQDNILLSKSVTAVWKDFLVGKTSWARPWSLYVLKRWITSYLM